MADIKPSAVADIVPSVMADIEPAARPKKSHWPARRPDVVEFEVDERNVPCRLAPEEVSNLDHHWRPLRYFGLHSHHPM